MRTSAKKREKQLSFYKGRNKAGCSEPGSLSYSQTPPLASFKMSGRQVYFLTNVLQLKKRAEKMPNGEENYVLEHKPHSDWGCAKTSKHKLERAGRTEEEVHLSDRQGRMIDSLCRPIGLHTFSLRRVSVNGGFSLSAGGARACLITVSPF